MDAQAVEKRALAGHAAADDTGQIGAEPEAALPRLAGLAPAEECGAAAYRRLPQPRALVRRDVRRVGDLAKTAVAAPLETDANARVAGDERLSQGFDTRACKLDPRMSTADVSRTVGVACMEERLKMRFHSFAEPGAVSQGIIGRLPVAELETGYCAMIEELQNLGLLRTEQPPGGIDVRREDERIPVLAGGAPPLLEFLQLVENVVRMLAGNL